MPNTTAAYNKALKQLNTAQRAAVEEIEGPVMVVAGPGTGKTTLLTTRIAYILQNRDVQPDNILCLTFTDAAAGNMRNRLREMIGQAGARVNVYTYHAFANEVIPELPWLQDRRDDLQPISNLERRQFIRRIIEGLPQGHVLKRYTPGAKIEGQYKGGLYFEVARMERLFLTIKAQYLHPETNRPDPERLIKACERYLDELREDPDYYYKRNTKTNKKGDFNEKKFDKIKSKLDLTIAAARLFPEYEAQLEAHGRYDFADMINWVNAAFNSDPDLLASYQERYQYFLVDEYQDTNGVQNALLFSLLTPAYGDPHNNPNVMIVGDDDQAIYRFQGADLSNMQTFQQRYADTLKLIVLDENYRSTQQILDFAGHVIAHNNERILNDPALQSRFPGLNKDLTAHASHAGPNQPDPEIMGFENQAQEWLSIESAITTLVQQETVAPEEIAVLYHNHSDAVELAIALRERGVAVRLQKKENVLAQPAVQHLLEILRYCYEAYRSPGGGAYALFRVLNFPYWGLEPRAVQTVIANYTVLTYQTPRGERRDVLSLLKDPKAHVGLTEEARERFIKLLEQMETAARKYAELPLVRFSQYAVQTFGIADFYLTMDHDLDQLQALRAFLLFVDSEASRNFLAVRTDKLPAAGSAKAGELFALLKLMEEEGVGLPLQRFETGANAVQFMTAHSSKGQEFDHVFVINTTAKRWDKEERGSRGEYKLPPGQERFSEQTNIEDERRLFYVACTRARKRLNISYAEQDLKERSQSPSRFIQEGLNDNPLQGPDKTQQYAPERVAHFLKSVLMPPPEMAIGEDLLRQLVDNYRLSASGLNTYLADPDAFLRGQLLRVPQEDQPALSLGNALHGALETYFSKSTTALQPYALLEEEYLAELERVRYMFTDFEYQTYRDWTKAYLPEYYEKMHKIWVPTGGQEVWVGDLELEGVPVKGKIDRLEEHPDGWVIVDFKSGKHVKSKDAPPKNDAQDKGQNWRQLVMYALMLEQHPRYKHKPVKAAYLEYIRPELSGEVPGRFAVNLDTAARETVMTQIHLAWQGIQSLDFDAPTD